MSVCGAVMQLLNAAFGCLVVLAIMASGFAMMFAPEVAKRLLKNVAIALGLFVLGQMAMGYFCAVVRHAMR